MSASERKPLVHDWNDAGPRRFDGSRTILVQDETLREGLQCPSAAQPEVETEIELLHLMERLGIHSASFGIPIASPTRRRAIERLCREVAAQRMNLRPNCGGRTLVADVLPIVEIQQHAGIPLEACLFIGSSPIRQYAESWDLDEMTRRVRDAVKAATDEGLSVTFITEDTTRSSPEPLGRLLRAAVDAGATRVCLCDTVGSAIPEGVWNLVGWVRSSLAEWGSAAGIDWHGHQDRGLGLANALTAIQAGADRIHATALGLGERVGNTSMEQLLVNLKLLGMFDRDLTPLADYVSKVSMATGLPIPPSAPIVGEDAYRTATGVHAAAIVKAEAKGDRWLAERVYSSVPASWLGRSAEILVGPVSGAANVRHRLRTLGLDENEAVVQAVLELAKRSTRVLTDDEIRGCLGARTTSSS